MESMGTVSTDRLLLRSIRPGGGWIALSAVGVLGTAAAVLLRPAALSAAVDAVQGHHRVVAALGRLAVVIVASLVAEVTAQIAGAAAKASTTSWLRTACLDRALRLHPGAARRFTVGDLLSRVVGSAPEAAEIGDAAVNALATAGYAVGGLVALGLIDWRLLIAFAVAAPIGLGLVRTFVRQATRLQLRYQELQAGISSRLVEALVGIRTIRAAGSQHAEVARVLAALPALAETGRDSWKSIGRLSSRSMLLTPLVEIVVLGVAGLSLAQGRITPGQLLATVGYTTLAMAIVGQGSALAQIGQARASAGRLAEVLSQPVMPHGQRHLPDGPGTLVLRGVTVKDQERRVLDDLDLVVPAGRMMAVVGRSGAGKSMVAAVAGRLVDPDRGEVILDDVPLRSLTASALRQAVRYGFDRPALLGTTIADAISYAVGSASDISLTGIETAAAAGAADAFVRRLPQGYLTPLAQAPLSGGEKQRLGLARVALCPGRLLILDDATSNLDTVTEEQVRAALADAFAGRTRIVIAHRAATAARADLVAWLDQGRIRAVAPHHQLCRVPEYRTLFAMEPVDE